VTHCIRYETWIQFRVIYTKFSYHLDKQRPLSMSKISKVYPQPYSNDSTS
jgi:hypothetical protein